MSHSDQTVVPSAAQAVTVARMSGTNSKICRQLARTRSAPVKDLAGWVGASL
jgi:hypothetical protein